MYNVLFMKWRSDAFYNTNCHVPAPRDKNVNDGEMLGGVGEKCNFDGETK